MDYFYFPVRRAEVNRLAKSECHFLLRKDDFSMFENFILESCRIYRPSGSDQAGK